MLVNFAESIYFAPWRENPDELFGPVSNRCSLEFYVPLNLKMFHIRFRFNKALPNQGVVAHKSSVWKEIQYADLLWVVTAPMTCEIWGYSLSATLWALSSCLIPSFWLDSVLWCRSAALGCDTGVYSALAGSEWCAKNRQLLCFWGCDRDHATLLAKRALLIVACCMKYPT